MPPEEGICGTISIREQPTSQRPSLKKELVMDQLHST